MCFLCEKQLSVILDLFIYLDTHRLMVLAVGFWQGFLRFLLRFQQTDRPGQTRDTLVTKSQQSRPILGPSMLVRRSIATKRPIAMGSTMMVVTFGDGSIADFMKISLEQGGCANNFTMPQNQLIKRKYRRRRYPADKHLFVGRHRIHPSTQPIDRVVTSNDIVP